MNSVDKEKLLEHLNKVRLVAEDNSNKYGGLGNLTEQSYYNGYYDAIGDIIIYISSNKEGEQ